MPLTAELRARTLALAAEVRALLASGTLPPPGPAGRCRQCSLADACAPDYPGEKRARAYVRRLMSAGPDPDLDAEAIEHEEIIE